MRLLPFLYEQAYSISTLDVEIIHEMIIHQPLVVIGLVTPVGYHLFKLAVGG